MSVRVLTQVEARTQEIGQELDQRLAEYRPRLQERLQDHLMVLLMQDDTLRTTMLRFVDVLAAVHAGRSGHRIASLFREYFQGDFAHLSHSLRLFIRSARWSRLPDRMVAWFARRLTELIARRFIVQSGQANMAAVLQWLDRQHRRPSFDLLGEAVVSETEAQAYVRAYLDLLDYLASHPTVSQRTAGDGPGFEVSLKLSSLTSQFNAADPEGTLARVRPRFEAICQQARRRGIGITVDAEQFAYRELGWFIFRRVMAPGEPLGDWPDAGMVIQAYLEDADAHARHVLDFARCRPEPFRVRLVKGAYWDQEVILAEQKGWPVPVYRRKGATDQTFERIIDVFLDAGMPARVAVASHNVRAHAYVKAVQEALELPPEAVEHQTLYGTLEALSVALSRMGWVTRTYIPVGELIPGMAYLVRRILENTSQAGFLTKSRRHEDMAELLRRPVPGEADLSYTKPAHPTGFVNTPAARLFDATERGQFAQALDATRRCWGETYPLQVGDERLETEIRVPSLSPSHPQAREPVGWVYFAGEREGQQAIRLANASAPAWAARPLAERIAIGLRAADIVRQRKNDLAAWIVHEGARNWPESLADVEEAIDHIVWNALQLRRLAGRVEHQYKPRGVVACIPPWNFPVALPAGMTSAALIAGNAVILKSAEQTPIVAHMLVEAFHEAGVPQDVLIHLPGYGDTIGKALVESPEVDMVAFTGSKEVGTWIYETAARVELTKGGIKHAVTEMGGKNAIVVFPDADMDETVLGILGSAFSHAGQKCSACSRVLVHREIFARLAQRLVEAAQSAPVGAADRPDTVVNPVIDADALNRIRSYANIARREGDVLLDLLEPGSDDGYQVGPLILRLDQDRAFRGTTGQEEIFGPVLPLIPFESEDEAVALVNSTVYGLTLGIFSRRPQTIRHMLRRCEAGNIYVNRSITGARVGIEPFGGFRLSGTGPKTGSEAYPLAFLTRREGFRTLSRRGSVEADPSQHTDLLAGLRSWQHADVITRLHLLRRAASRLGDTWRPIHAESAAWATGARPDLQNTLSALLDTVSETAAAQYTVKIPGQDNFVLWDTPRGLGLVACDDGSDPATLAGLVYGPLVAGNGVVVVTTERHYDFARALVETLHHVGVPKDVVRLAPQNTSAAALASGAIHFAAVDVSLSEAQGIYSALGPTSEACGQTWLKALISVSEGPRPGEPGYLRLFAHPKAIAIQTLRHGADLAIMSTRS
jgi:RHH-type proline utilization regulon transcriptional repressor/proline dehydrogenase/delta 1-pyrroline-5-carboxylate dehydrogenase